MRKAYSTDVSDAEWSYLETYLPPPKPCGRPRLHRTREVLNTIFYIVRGGAALGGYFPTTSRLGRPFTITYRAWCLDGTWEGMHAAALRQRARVRLKRNPHPSAGIVDTQSVKTTGVGGQERGYDGGKKVKGRKRRHLLVDTQGLVLEVKVHSAKVMDREGTKLLLERTEGRLPRLSHLWLDAGYNGQGKGADWVERRLWAGQHRDRQASTENSSAGGAGGMG